MWKKLSDIGHDIYGLKTILHIFIGFVLYIISQLAAAFVVDLIYLLTRLEWPTFFIALRCLLEVGLFYLVLRLYILKALKLSLYFFRIAKPRFSLAWLLTAFLLPAVVILYYFTFTKGTISYGNGDPLLLNIVFALKVGLSAGITEELLFRGFIMKLLEKRWNKMIAILLPSALFASLHLMNGMGSADAVLLFIAGTTVGIMFSLVTFHNENVFYSAMLHAVWNTVILGIFRIAPQIDNKVIINYTIDNNNILITGGRFGIEAAIPAIVGYLAVILITFVWKKNNSVLNKG